MLRQLQVSLNRFIERFQDRWETQPSFRATWSIIGGAFAIIFIASSLLVSLNIANSLTSGSDKPSANTGANVLYAGGNGGQQTPRPVSQASPNITPTPAANPIATSNAPTPLPTASPTPGAGTPSATGTPGDGTPTDGTPTATIPPGETVTAQQQPTSGWAPTGQNQITNVVTNPRVPDGQIDFKLDFGCKQIDVLGQLDGNGTAQTIQQSVNIPSCFNKPTPQVINVVAVTINGQQVQFTQPPFYAKGQ